MVGKVGCVTFLGCERVLNVACLFAPLALLPVPTEEFRVVFFIWVQR